MLGAQAFAGVISGYSPVNSSVTNDLYLVDHTNSGAGTLTTKVIPFQSLQASIGTNLTVTNGKFLGSTASNLTLNGTIAGSAILSTGNGGLGFGSSNLVPANATYAYVDNVSGFLFYYPLNVTVGHTYTYCLPNNDNDFEIAYPTNTEDTQFEGPAVGTFVATTSSLYLLGINQNTPVLTQLIDITTNQNFYSSNFAEGTFLLNSASSVPTSTLTGEGIQYQDHVLNINPQPVTLQSIIRANTTNFADFNTDDAFVIQQNNTNKFVSIKFLGPTALGSQQLGAMGYGQSFSGYNGSSLSSRYLTNVYYFELNHSGACAVYFMNAGQMMFGQERTTGQFTANYTGGGQPANAMDNVIPFFRVSNPNQTVYVTNAGNASLIVDGTNSMNVETANAVTVSNSIASQHFNGRGTSPTYAVGTGAGTGATMSLDASATDASGLVTVTTGSTPVSSATIFTLTFNTAYATAPHVVVYPGNANAAAWSGGSYQEFASTTTTTMVLTAGVTDLQGGATVYKWYYLITQ